MSTRTIDDKPRGEAEQRLIAEIEKKHGKTVDQLREEREKRVSDAIELRVPDRVPVNVGTGVFAARYAGLPASAMYYDHAAYAEAHQDIDRVLISHRFGENQKQILPT